MALTTQLPPAKPSYVLRGHSAQVHALAFSPQNHRLLVGDANGWIVNWSLAYKRPVAVWKAHEASILGVAWWGGDALITHGRDGRLILWEVDETDRSLSKVLPIDYMQASPNHDHDQLKQQPPKEPNKICELVVNTLNFCSFAHALLSSTDLLVKEDSRPGMVLALPNTETSEAIDIHTLSPPGILSPVGCIPAPTLTAPRTGMSMSLAFASPTILFAGYESGHVIGYALPKGDIESNGIGDIRASSACKWSCIYRSRPHSQPVLSLAIHPSAQWCISTSADAVIAEHAVPRRAPTTSSSAHWTYQLASGIREEIKTGLLAHQVLDSTAATRVTKTGHAGQQGAAFRSDGKIFATAGWDARARAYVFLRDEEEDEANGSDGRAGSMISEDVGIKEVAVLKWHTQGCYIVAFARVRNPETQISGDENDGALALSSGPERNELETKVVSTVVARREEKIRSTHWLAVGSKDGKVSLWDIY